MTALHAAGIPIAVGTDAGGSVGTTYHGWATLRELELLVGAGLSPLEAITAATGTSARALRVDKERGTIEAGKLADLVMVKGAPEQAIAGLQNVQRVWVAGKEADLKALEALIATHAKAPIEPVRLSGAILDDFEAADGLTRTKSRWENGTDPGQDRSKMQFTRVPRESGGHALSMIATMSEKEQPRALLRLPLQPGNVVPVDASEFRGVSFEARGEGQYELRIPRYSVQDARVPHAEFRADATWQTIRIPFTALGIESARDLLSLEFAAERKAESQAWLELDNVQFYK